MMTMSAYLREDNRNKNLIMKKIKAWEEKNEIKEARYDAE